jgi:hypothetical protein
MNRIAKIGGAIVRAYLNHLLWFTIGVVVGSVQTFVILAGIWL